MINMNSPTVQNIIQSQGYNPFTNNQYIPQQQVYYQQPQTNYYNNYNPYTMYSSTRNNNYTDNNLYSSYDSMPTCIVNQYRNIHSEIKQQPIMQQAYGYNNAAFNGYINPILESNRREQERINQRKLAIEQGKIWRSLFGMVEGVDIDEVVKEVESLYYNEPVQESIPIKEKIIMDKNRHLAEVEARLDYYRQNNIPIITPFIIEKNNFYNYYNHINSIIGDPDDCDMYKYFTEVYPKLKQEQLAEEAEHYNKNLKTRYNNGEFNKLIDKNSADRPDSYYYKMMQTFANDGVKLTNGDGLTITADQMEVKLPERFMTKHKKNKQDLYYEQRKKFYETIFRKDN